MGTRDWKYYNIYKHAVQRRGITLSPIPFSGPFFLNLFTLSFCNQDSHDQISGTTWVHSSKENLAFCIVCTCMHVYDLLITATKNHTCNILHCNVLSCNLIHLIALKGSRHSYHWAHYTKFKFQCMHSSVERSILKCRYQFRKSV